MARTPSRRYIGYHFLILIAFLGMTLANEGLDLPHYLLGDDPTSFTQRRGEVLTELLIAGLAIALELVLIGRLRREIRILEGLIPICANPKKVRVLDDWHPLERDIEVHSHAEFSHGLCPPCVETFYPDVARRLRAKRSPSSNPEGDAP